MRVLGGCSLEYCMGGCEGHRSGGTAESSQAASPWGRSEGTHERNSEIYIPCRQAVQGFSGLLVFGKPGTGFPLLSQLSSVPAHSDRASTSKSLPTGPQAPADLFLKPLWSLGPDEVGFSKRLGGPRSWVPVYFLFVCLFGFEFFFFF